MRWPGAADGLVGEAVRARRTILAVARFAALGFEEAKRLALADGGRYCVAIDAVLDELLVGDRQFTVVLAAVALELDGPKATGRETPDSPAL
jgi:hypothetical protein